MEGILCSYFKGIELDDGAIFFTGRGSDVSCPDQAIVSSDGVFYYGKTPIDTGSIIINQYN